MIVLKVPLKQTQKIKKQLIKKDLIDSNYQSTKDKKYFYFSIKKAIKLPNTKIIKKKLLKNKNKPITLKQALKPYLTKNQLKLLKTSYDTVGEIVILEIPRQLEKKQTIIAKQLLKINNNIKTVVKKKNIHHGIYRTQQTTHLMGKKTKITTYKENNIKLKINIDKTYFSVRLATERKRIAKQVKPNENILVMFSGVAPYPCVLAKNTKAKHITAIEINPYAHKLAQINIQLNKLKNITLINNDVKKAVPKLKQKFDRILMPLPKTAEEFLLTALKVAKKHTIIHLYDFLNEKEFKKVQIKIKQTCKKCKILRIIKCGQQAPRVYRICVDVEIL